MFGEHREQITQIILTAAEENVCLLCTVEGKLGGDFSLSLFLLFLREADEHQLI